MANVGRSMSSAALNEVFNTADEEFASTLMVSGGC